MHRYLCCSDACCRARLHIGKDCIGFGVGGSRGDLQVKDAVGPWRNRPLPNHRGQKEHKRVEPPAPRHPLHSAPLGLLFSFACAQYDEDTSLLSSLYVSPAGPGGPRAAFLAGGAPTGARASPPGSARTPARRGTRAKVAVAIATEPESAHAGICSGIRMAGVEFHRVFVLSLLCAVSSNAAAASHEQQPAPRLFPRPMELNLLGPMTDTLGIDACSFACATQGSGWDAARLTPARWPVPPETAFEIYRPLILRGANCTHVGVHDLKTANPAGQLRELSVMLNVSKGASNASTEHYAINVQAGGAALIVSSYVGLVRGLETFSQLVTPSDPRVVDADLRIPASVRIRGTHIPAQRDPA